MTIPLTDATLRDILISVVGNGLWCLVAQSGAKAYREVRTIISPPQPSVVAAIRKAVDRLSLNPFTEPTQNRLMAYLKSPEVESTVRQLFATSLIGSKEPSTLDSIKRELISAMSKYLDVDESRLQPFAESLLAALVASVEDALHAAIEKNMLSAHEATSAARYRMLRDEISNLQKTIRFLGSEPSLDVAAILEFEDKYREQVGSVHAYIKPPDLESGRRVPIDEIFVPPQISLVPHQKTEEPETLPLPMFLSRLYRAVLLGNPGGGKSTVLTKICYDLATRYSKRLFAGREITPSLVILREYGSQKKATNCSIVQFIEGQANSRYQLKPPENAFEYLLLSGRLLIIFDGLDELLDSSYRQEITSNVEAFCKLYPSAPVLITSRERGYEQAPLDDRVFNSFRLAPFDEDQVRDYAKKWFARDEDYSPEQRAQKAEAFFSDSAFVPDLRSNPLMLGLMCNLYRAEGYIPRNRPEVYGKCSVMLFERWDKSRDIIVPLPFEEHIRPAMQDLAFWIYSHADLQGGVTEQALIERTSDYLCKWVFDDPTRATLAASEFIRYCTGRAWVFTDTGTTREGEKLFEFAHRTFLEYFTACYLVSVHPTPQLLIESLKMRIGNGEWDVVAQLAFQVQSKHVHGAADDLLAGLLKIQHRTVSKRWNTLSFAERSLGFLVPSPRMRREITRAGLNFWLSQVKRDTRSQLLMRSRSPGEIGEHIGNLLLATAENRDTVADEIAAFLKETMFSAESKACAPAAELSLRLPSALYLSQTQFHGSKDLQDYWGNVSERIVTSCTARIQEIAHFGRSVALHSYWRRLLPLSEAIAAFGVQFALEPLRDVALSMGAFFPPGHVLVASALGLSWSRETSQEEREKRVGELESLAEAFLESPRPWVKWRAQESPPSLLADYSRERDDVEIEAAPMSPNATFAMLCVLAADLEQFGGWEDRKTLEKALQRQPMIPKKVGLVLLGRFSGAGRGESLRELDSFAFSGAQRDFLARWINREIDLVQGRGAARQRKRSRPSKGRAR